MPITTTTRKSTLDYIKASIEKAIKEMIDEEIELAKKRIDKKKDEIIASIALNVTSNLSITDYQERIVIEIQKTQK